MVKNYQSLNDDVGELVDFLFNRKKANLESVLKHRSLGGFKRRLKYRKS
jgi:hypothetical protein